MKTFSIITVNYNNCKGLQKTIESVLQQTCEDYEYIIIDGGSTDGSKELIEQYKDRLNYWESTPDKGIYHAMNKGIRKATGEYCNFLNSGDYFYTASTLSEISSLLQADIVLGRDYRTGCGPQGHGFDKEVISLLDLWREPLNHQSAFIKRSLFTKDLYDESYKLLADQKFFVKALILENCSFQTLPTLVVYYDMNGVSAQKADLFQEEKHRLFRELLPARIYKDYDRFIRYDSPLLELIPRFNKTYRFHKFIYQEIKITLSIYSKLKNLYRKIFGCS